MVLCNDKNISITCSARINLHEPCPEKRQLHASETHFNPGQPAHTAGLTDLLLLVNFLHAKGPCFLILISAHTVMYGVRYTHCYVWCVVHTLLHMVCGTHFVTYSVWYTHCYVWHLKFCLLVKS